MHPFGEIGGQFVHLFFHPLCHVQGVGSRKLIDGDCCDGSAFQGGGGAVAFTSELYSGQVTDAKVFAVGKGLDDDIAEFFFIDQ